ncbi:helix-turn-helix domain-containing protein [Fulvimonas yonginensis]|uniref:Helix-turn-helix domain-containing protein n=1 Tax=Fulvimonas yonginensis TaxID=1495200 RepID=A0ABU8JDT7_9GAMM
MARPRSKLFACPVDVALSVIQGKWKPAILWSLAGGARRFRDFQAALPQVAHKVLSEQLRQLERDGVILRREREGADGGPDYVLTDFGRSLRPALNALARWGKAHHRKLGAQYVLGNAGDLGRDGTDGGAAKLPV